MTFDTLVTLIKIIFIIGSARTDVYIDINSSLVTPVFFMVSRKWDVKNHSDYHVRCTHLGVTFLVETY